MGFSAGTMLAQEKMSGAQPMGDVFFVDSASGRDGNDGSSKRRPLLTIARAVALASAGDTILIRGTFSEAVTVTGKAGLRIIGVGSNSSEALWQGATDTVSLTIAANANCWIENIRFRPNTYTAGVPAAIHLTGASKQTYIVNCRFQGRGGSWYAIYSDGQSDNLHILDCEFVYNNTATYGTAIKSSGAADLSGVVIQGNLFHSNLNDIVAPMRQSIIRNNVFASTGLLAAGSAGVTVLGIDIHGAATGLNIVTGNFIGGLYHQACYYGGTADHWAGNYCVDRTHATQVDATTGISILAPAA